MRKLTFEEITKIINDFGLILISEYTHSNNKITVIDNNGYKFYTTVGYLKSGRYPEMFSPTNPYTIDNINLYIKLNKIECSLVSKEYVRNSYAMEWKCKCGNIFTCNLNNFKIGKHLCNECSIKNGAKKKTRDYETVYNEFKIRGYELVSEEYISCKQPLIAINPEGYKVYSSYDAFQTGNPSVFHPSNPYTIDNIKKALYTSTTDEFTLLSNEYKNNKSELKIVHNSCGNTFAVKWNSLYRIIKTEKVQILNSLCPYCSLHKLESTHASVLKQIFLNLLPNGTVIEDNSCRNPNTGYPLPTDIVNHVEKIAIEIQSAFHDNPNQQIKDNVKKEYWLKKGYQFYDPDIRNYTVIEMVQLFFPELNEIPSWVQYNFNKKLDTKIVQSLLNDGHRLAEISRIMNVKLNRLTSAITNKRIYYPEFYHKK